jgi:uncharacterized membrane protein
MFRFTTCAAACALALSTQVFSHESRTVELQYRIFEIPFIPAYEGEPGMTWARSINDRGEVLVGSAHNSMGGPTISHFFIWHRGHRSPELVTPDPTLRFMDLIQINNRSEVVGTVVDDFEGTPPKARAVIWRRGQPTVIGPSPDDNSGSTHASALNDWGEVVGWSTDPNSAPAFRWFRGHFEVVPTAQVGDLAAISALNNRGQAVGGGSAIGGFIWDRKGRVQAIEGLPGVTPQPFAMNDRGQVVGMFFEAPPGTGERPFLWQDGAAEELPILEGALLNLPRAINNAGTAVGVSGESAVVWREGKVYDLNELVVTQDPKIKRAHLDVAWDINNFGWIAAEGYDPTEQGQPEHAYVLVPEWRHRR